MEPEEVDQIVQLYQKHKNGHEVAKRIDYSSATVYKVLRREEVCRTPEEYHDDSRKKLSKGHDKMDEKLAYIYGVLITDGYETKSGIGLETIDKEFCDRFQEFCEEKYGIEGGRYNGKKKESEIRGSKFTSKQTEIYRLNSVNLKESIEDIDFIEELNNLEDRELKIEALKGMWDSDGSLNVEGRQVVFYKSDEDVVNLYTSLISDLIRANYKVTNKRRTKVCKFGTKGSVREFYEVVDPTIERKREKLETMIE